MAEKPAEVICPACGRETFVRREPRYEGFTKTGETLICISCGHGFDDSEPLAEVVRTTPEILTSNDRSPQVDLFTDDEKQKNCRHCKHYVVNPFTQRCGLHQKTVEATDVCFDFEPPDKPKEEPSHNSPPEQAT